MCIALKCVFSVLLESVKTVGFECTTSSSKRDWAQSLFYCLAHTAAVFSSFNFENRDLIDNLRTHYIIISLFLVPRIRVYANVRPSSIG